MSGYNYAGRSGYADCGTRTYVTRIEERVEQVRRPSAMGSAYSLAMEAEKDGRPREVDDFIMKILNEVNGPTVSTLSRGSESVRDHHGLPAKVGPTGDYGVDYKFGVDSPTKVGPGRGRYYAVQYMYVGSPMESRASRNYEDPFDQHMFSSHGSDQPYQNDYSAPNRWDGSRLKSEAPRDYEVPKNRWESSSRPIYDALPYNPAIESHSSKSYEATPESPRYNPNNLLKSEMAKDYGVPNNHWIKSTIKPMPPKANEGSGDQWSRSANPDYDQPQADNNNARLPNGQWGNSPMKPRTSGYGDSDDNRWSRPLKPIYDHQAPNGRSLDIQQGSSPVKPFSSDGYGFLDNEKGRSLGPEYDHPPRNEIISGAPINRWGNSPSKSVYDQKSPNEDNSGAIDRQRGNSSPSQSPKVYGVSDNSIPNYDPPPQNKDRDGGSKKLGNSPLKPIFDQVPPNDSNGGPLDGRQSSSMKPQSSKGYGVHENQRGGSTSPDYEHPPQNEIIGGISSNRWGNSPPRTQSPSDHGARNNQQWGQPSSPVKPGPLKGLEVPKDLKGRSNTPEYEHPPRNEITRGVPNDSWGKPSLKVQIPQNVGGHNNGAGVSLGHDSRQPLENVHGDANTQWGNSPVRTQSPRVHETRGNQWGSPSSPFYDAYNGKKHEQSNVAGRDGVPASGNKPNVSNYNTSDHEPKGNLSDKDNQPKEYGTSNQMKPSGYQASPRNQATSPLGKASDKTGDILGQQRVSAGVSSQPKYSVYSAPSSQVVTISPGVLDSKGAQKRYGD